MDYLPASQFSISSNNSENAILMLLIHTTQDKILEGENFGEFGKSQEVCQNFLVQKFSIKKLIKQYSAHVN